MISANSIPGTRRLLILSLVLTLSALSAYAQCRSARDTNLKNRVYSLRSADVTQNRTERLKVSHGYYEDQSDPQSLAFLYFRIIGTAYGDLTGDGREEAAVAAVYGSNSATFYLTGYYIFGCVGGKIKVLDILYQDRIEKDSHLYLQESVKHPLKIKNGIVYITHGTGGNRPSPEYTTTFRYKMRGGRLIPYKPPLMRRNYY